MEQFVYRDFARLEDTHWWFVGRRAVVSAFLERHLAHDRVKTVLDVGCGTGGMLPLLGQWGQVSAFDAADEALEAARTRAPAGTTLWKGEVPEGIRAGPKYDLVTAFDVLEHLDDPVGAAQRVREVLAPGGVFVASVPAYPFLWSSHDEVTHHRRRYTLESLSGHLEQGGLRVTASTYFNALLFPPIAAVRLLQRVLPSRGTGSDFEETVGPLNAVLARLFSAEAKLVARTRLPVGVSLIVLARPLAPVAVHA